MNKRIGSGLAALFLLLGMASALSFSGCTVSKPGKVDGETGGDLSIASFYNIWPDDENTAIGAAIKAYKEQYGAKVTYNQYDYSVYNNKMMQMVAGGNAPDIMVAYGIDMPRLAAIELIQPVDNFVKVSEQNWPEIMDSYTWKSKHYAGNVQQVQTPLLWFNKTLMEREGVDKNPYTLWKDGKWNWDTFLALGEKMTKDTNADGETDQWGFNTAYTGCFQWANNAHMVQVDKMGKVSITWKEEANLNAIKFFQKIRFDKVIMPQDMSKFKEDFATGKLAMTCGTYEFLADVALNFGMDADSVGVAPFPVGPNFQDHYYGQTNLLTIPSGAKNPEGAGKLCELISQKEKELFPNQPNFANPDVDKILKEDHLEVINAVTSKTRVNYDSGWGNWDPTSLYNRRLIYDKQDPVTVLDTLEPLLQAAITDLLNSTVGDQTASDAAPDA